MMVPGDKPGIISSCTSGAPLTLSCSFIGIGEIVLSPPNIFRLKLVQVQREGKLGHSGSPVATERFFITPIHPGLGKTEL